MEEKALKEGSSALLSQELPETPAGELSVKQKQFNAALELYNSGKTYKFFGIMVSITNISLQTYLLYRAMSFSLGFTRQVAALVVAFVATDFINGLVHVYMDKNDDYESIAGPLIANFHLHHKTPRYKRNLLPIVYFNETGSKVWLVGYLLAVVVLLEASRLDHAVLCTLVYIGVLSSVAEVSHYLCHSSNSAAAGFLAGIGLLLSKRHHAKHHVEDNTSYAFLNGVTDPLINLIARRYSGGYKNTTDLHYAHYTAMDAESR
ncbi:MAG: fatty acid desaturase CarF family protein [Syntrophales bacterium]|nr:fatty acid desaturase CarF family protein [Syntrophales bacterium]